MKCFDKSGVHLFVLILSIKNETYNSIKWAQSERLLLYVGLSIFLSFAHLYMWAAWFEDRPLEVSRDKISSFWLGAFSL